MKSSTTIWLLAHRRVTSPVVRCFAPISWGGKVVHQAGPAVNRPPGQIDRRSDTDLDGDVDLGDLTTVIINFTSTGALGKTWNHGDADGGGEVNTGDLTTAIINFTSAQAVTLQFTSKGLATVEIATSIARGQLQAATSDVAWTFTGGQQSSD